MKRMQNLEEEILELKNIVDESVLYFKQAKKEREMYLYFINHQSAALLLALKEIHLELIGQRK